MRNLIIYCFLFISFQCKANPQGTVLELPYEDEPETTFSHSLWHFSVGNYFDLPSTYQVTSNGKKNSLEFWPIINLGKIYQGYFYEKFLFQWNALISLPKVVGTSDLTRTLLAFDLLLGHSFSYLGSFSTGISFFQQALFFKENGQIQTENSSNAGQFYRPNRLVLVSQQALVFAYRTALILDHFSMEAKTYTFSLWDKEKRATSYALNILYQW